jgi:hypothetical protein
MSGHNPHNPIPYEPGVFPATMLQAGASSPQDIICNWLRELGLDPSLLPADPRASMKDGQLTLLRKVTKPGTNGGLIDVVTPDRTGVMTETITVPVTVPPPPLVEIWLAPTCPTCGR